MDDLISRKALLEEFNLWYECLGGTMNQKNWIVQDTISSAIDIINEAPAVDAEPVRHGVWGETQIIGYDGIHPVYAKPCSECGHLTDMYRPRVCPNCGAKMGGAEG